jgi:hypothetical protein
VKGGWRKLHNEELSYLYFSPNIVRMIKSRRMRWAGHVAHMGERTGVNRVLVETPDRKRPLVRLRRRSEENIKMDFQEVRCGVMKWIEVARDRNNWRVLLNAVMIFRVSQNAGISCLTENQLVFKKDSSAWSK